tara:strand:- start:4003 stop:4560 length:558 start_codon:yes stop_codon:yes gene_type:complete
MNRLIDLIFSIVLGLAMFAPAILIACLIISSSKGPIIHWSKRIGIANKEFLMPKFRTMYVDTPDIATHLLEDDKYITTVGFYLRKLSLDEIPQLWSIFKGDMTLVGPRPALHNQFDLIKLRTKSGVNNLVPGITGWAQINGRDNISIEDKANLDYEYLLRRSLFFDLKIIFVTMKHVVGMKNIRH